MWKSYWKSNYRNASSTFGEKNWSRDLIVGRTYAGKCFKNIFVATPKEEDTKVSFSDTVTLQSLDQRKFAAQKYERQYSWLYFSHVKKGFLCKYCKLFGVSLSVSPFINKGVDLGTHPTRTLDTHNLMRTNVINLLFRGILYVKQIQMSTDSWRFGIKWLKEKKKKIRRQ